MICQGKALKWPAGALMLKTPDNVFTPDDLIEFEGSEEALQPTMGGMGRKRRTVTGNGARGMQ